MRKWTKTAGLLFLAAASVYSCQVIVAAVGSGAPSTAQASTPTVLAAAPSPKAQAIRMYAPPDGATDVKILDEASDPFANTPATAPATGEDATADAGTTSATGETATATGTAGATT